MMPARTRGATAVAIIVTLVIIDLVIVGIVISGGRSHDLAIRRVETVKAFYAAEAGMNMAIREVMLDEEQDGDCAVGSISHDDQEGTDPGFGSARWVVTASTVVDATTLRSYGRAGDAQRQLVAVIDLSTTGPLFSDDFEDATLTGWTNIGSDLLEESGGVLHTASGVNADSHYSIDDGTAWDDYTFSVDVKGVDNDISGVSFRIQDASNYYLLRQGFGDNAGWDLDLHKVQGGAPTELAATIDNYGSSPGQVDDTTTWYTLKVMVSGASIKCYVDDVLKFDVTDSAYGAGTAGVWLESQRDGQFDNVLVE